MEELQAKINELEQKIIELEKFVNQKKIQQISFPLDEVSKKIIENI